MRIRNLRLVRGARDRRVRRTTAATWRPLSGTCLLCGNRQAEDIADEVAALRLGILALNVRTPNAAIMYVKCTQVPSSDKSHEYLPLVEESSFGIGFAFSKLG